LIRDRVIGPLSALIVAQWQIRARRAKVPADNTFNQRNAIKIAPLLIIAFVVNFGYIDDFDMIRKQKL